MPETRYLLKARTTFNVEAPIQYLLKVKTTFNVIDGIPPIIINPYCLNQDDNVITILDSHIKIGASNIYDEHTTLATIEYRYGLNDPATPVTYIDNTPIEGPNSHIFDGTLSFTAGDTIYYRILATDTSGNIADTGTLIIVVEGIPTRYALRLKTTFNITGKVPKLPIAVPIYIATDPILMAKIRLI